MLRGAGRSDRALRRRRRGAHDLALDQGRSPPGHARPHAGAREPARREQPADEDRGRPGVHHRRLPPPGAARGRRSAHRVVGERDAGRPLADRLPAPRRLHERPLRPRRDPQRVREQQPRRDAADGERGRDPPAPPVERHDHPLARDDDRSRRHRIVPRARGPGRRDRDRRRRSRGLRAEPRGEPGPDRPSTVRGPDDAGDAERSLRDQPRDPAPPPALAELPRRLFARDRSRRRQLEGRRGVAHRARRSVPGRRERQRDPRDARAGQRRGGRRRAQRLPAHRARDLDARPRRGRPLVLFHRPERYLQRSGAGRDAGRGDREPLAHADAAAPDRAALVLYGRGRGERRGPRVCGRHAGDADPDQAHDALVARRLPRRPRRLQRHASSIAGSTR